MLRSGTRCGSDGRRADVVRNENRFQVRFLPFRFSWFAEVPLQVPEKDKADLRDDYLALQEGQSADFEACGAVGDDNGSRLHRVST